MVNHQSGYINNIVGALSIFLGKLGALIEIEHCTIQQVY